jgi:iron complex outermembrane receptor protein
MVSRKCGHFFRAALAASTAIGLIASLDAAVAQTSANAVAYNIPAQPLTAALTAVAQRGGLRLAYSAVLSAGRSAPALQGSFTPAQAIERLLAGTGLTYRFTSPNTVTIERPGATNAGGAMPAGAIALDTIDVQGAGNPNSTMALPPAYAGGQVATGAQLGLLGNRSIMDTPFNQTSYTAQLVQNQQARFLTEALNNDPSVMTAGSRTTGTDRLGIRGFAVNNTSVLFNGLQGVAPGGNDATILAESFERIEVLKGPSSLLNGIVNNVGGSINLVPKRAADESLTQFTPDYSMNSQFGGHVDVGRRFGDNKEFGMRFNGVYRDGNTTVDHQSRQTALATLGLDYRGERLRVDGDFGYQKAKVQGVRRNTQLANGIQVPEAPDNRTNWFYPAEFTGSEVLYGSLRGEFDVTDRLTAFASFGGSQSYQTRFSPNRVITSVLGTVAGGSFPGDTSLANFDSLSWLTGLRARLETGFVQHQIVFAFNSFEQTTGNSVPSGAPSTPFPASSIYNPIYGRRRTPLPGATSEK